MPQQGPEPGASRVRDGLPAPVNLDDLMEPFASRGVDLSLERLRRALAAGGHPERRFTAVQVAGTNGKGSIATFLHAILQAAGLHCGVYRSPHLVSWCERIVLGEHWIDPATLRADLGRWRDLANAHQLTPFELFTAAAFARFAAADLAFTVLEVGLGGRLDATTVHPHRPVVGFGAIGLDHCEQLGSDLAAIAAEKAGVLSPGCVAISGPQEPEAAQVLSQAAARVGAELRWVDPLATEAEGGPVLGLAGAIQRSNAAVAVAMASALAERCWPVGARALDGAALAAGLAAARWPGRLETRHYRGTQLLLDGAHNPPAATMLRRELERRGAGQRHWLLGIQRHKDAPTLMRELLAEGDRALVVPIAGCSCWSLRELAQACPALAGQMAEAPDVAAGLAQLVEPVKRVDGIGLEPSEVTAVVAGSLHLLGEVIPLLDAD
jgi:dihydrofolate synthase/folylpolyglutamate synthase